MKDLLRRLLDAISLRLAARIGAHIDASRNAENDVVGGVLAALGLTGETYGPSCRTFDVEQLAAFLASIDSARYVLDHMGDAHPAESKMEVLDLALNEAKNEGLVLEFGVYTGGTISHIARRFPADHVYGFDSFEGLPEHWHARIRAGSFDLGGAAPDGLPDNVRLVPGLFDESLPKFCTQQNGIVKFLHVDSDLYSSAKTIFDNLRDRIVAGTVIVFDEFFNYPGWKMGEHKAFEEFCQQKPEGRWKYIAYAKRSQSIALKMV